jgi:hypothetical protein
MVNGVRLEGTDSEDGDEGSNNNGRAAVVRQGETNNKERVE